MNSDLPDPTNWTVGPRIRYYRDLGLNCMGYSGELLGRSPDNDLSLYILAKMLWDADQDDRKLIEEFFSLYFQEAAEPMWAYYRRLNQVGHKWQNRRPWSAKELTALSKLLKRAIEAARQPVVQRRIQRERNSLEFYTLFFQAKHSSLQWKSAPTPEHRQQALQAMEDALDYLKQIVDQDIVYENWVIRRLKGMKVD